MLVLYLIENKKCYYLDKNKKRYYIISVFDGGKMTKKVSLFKSPLFLKPKTFTKGVFSRNNMQSLAVSQIFFKDATQKRTKRFSLKEHLPKSLR